MEIAASTAARTSAGTTTSQIGLADNFNSFLRLLTTQLKSQDPLAPMDANQFTEQLVQFTGVEQAIKTNDALGQLVSLVRADQIGRAVDYLGAEVEAKGQTLRLDGDRPATIHYELGEAATEVTIEIYDEAGKMVSTKRGEASLGAHDLSWDGRGPSGARLADGLYRVEVSATRSGGDPVPVSTAIRGIVDGVELGGDRLMLSVGGVQLPLDAITTIRRPLPVA